MKNTYNEESGKSYDEALDVPFGKKICHILYIFPTAYGPSLTLW